MSEEDFIAQLRRPPPTPADEICKCVGVKPIKLKYAFSYNPLRCIDCNLEIEPESLALEREMIQSIAYWRSLYAAINSLWLASGEYAEWAESQLADISSPVNVAGMA